MAAELWIDPGTGPAQEGVVAFAPTALLAANLPDDPEARVIPVTGWRDIGEVGIGTLASLGERWQQFTGANAIMVETGETFEEQKAKRMSMNA